jgi:hypothetical protein
MRVVSDVGPNELVKYYHAALEVVYKNRQSHNRIRNWKTQLSDDEFYQMWLEKWKTLGLNSSKLQQIYELVKTWEKFLLLEKVKKPQIIM